MITTHSQTKVLECDDLICKIASYLSTEEQFQNISLVNKIFFHAIYNSNLPLEINGYQFLALDADEYKKQALAKRVHHLSFSVEFLNKQAIRYKNLVIKHFTNLRSLNLSHSWIRNIQPLFAQLRHLPKIEILCLSDNKIGRLRNHLVSFDLFKNLNFLDLSANCLTSQDVASLKLPQSLEHLDLSYNLLSNSGARNLDLNSVPNLTFLDLTSNQIGVRGIKDLQIKELKHLHTLILGKNILSHESSVILYAKLPRSITYLDISITNQGLKNLCFADLPKLQTLCLHNSSITGRLQAFKSLQFLPTLTTLSISTCGDHRMDLRDFPSFSLQKLQYLQIATYFRTSDTEVINVLHPLINLQTLKLDFRSIDFDDIDGENFPFSRLKNLKKLDLSNNNLYGCSLLRLPIHQLHNLEKLNLHNTQIKTDNLIWLKMASCPNLRYLNLSSNALNDTCFEVIDLKNLKNLTELDLSNNKITGNGALKIAFHALKKLKVLNLFENKLGPNGLVNLKIHECPSLERIHLGKNNINNYGILFSALTQPNLTFPSLNFIGLELNPFNIFCIEALLENLQSFPKIKTISVRSEMIPKYEKEELAYKFNRPHIFESPFH